MKKLFLNFKIFFFFHKGPILNSLSNLIQIKHNRIGTTIDDVQNDQCILLPTVFYFWLKNNFLNIVEHSQELKQSFDLLQKLRSNIDAQSLFTPQQL